jgi:hypothetical protein
VSVPSQDLVLATSYVVILLFVFIEWLSGFQVLAWDRHNNVTGLYVVYAYNILCLSHLVYTVYIGFARTWWRLFQERVMRFYYMSQHPKKLHTTFQAAWQYRGRGKQIKSVTYVWWMRTVCVHWVIVRFVDIGEIVDYHSVSQFFH